MNWTFYHRWWLSASTQSGFRTQDSFFTDTWNLTPETTNSLGRWHSRLSLTWPKGPGFLRRNKFTILGVEVPVRQGAKTQEYRDIPSFRNAAGRDTSGYKMWSYFWVIPQSNLKNNNDRIPYFEIHYFLFRIRYSLFLSFFSDQTGRLRPEAALTSESVFDRCLLFSVFGSPATPFLPCLYLLF